ncbi:MAG: pyridoxamine 5'-phosphate oxidase family protein [Lachnospiraceae bacterium]|jgi:uncharacterized pyridoxamine 5'-phosphate oxidase family protein|nr:pyridoxamine 5'-phosphate oxidase family protein [Lachnospiraceae bacterium]
MEEVLKFLKKTGTYYIATVEGNQPRVRPFGTINLFEGKLYIQSSHKKDFAKQVKENGKVEICAFDGETWLRVKTTLIDNSTPEAITSMMDAYPELKPMYEGSDCNAVYYLKDAVARFYNFVDDEPKVIEF